MNRTQLKAGFEVAWCSEMPELDGEPDIDRATYCHRDFATIAEAHAFATKVVPLDYWGQVVIRPWVTEEGYREYLNESAITVEAD